MPDPQPRPLVGGYYWFPTPTGGGTNWTVLTCHDLGFDDEVGHVDLWPSLVDRLAAAWGREERALGRRLKDYYTGLPRGRVTRPDKTILILHGHDAPVTDWRERLIESFHLERRDHRFLYDEHERMLPGDPERVEEALGVRLAETRYAPAFEPLIRNTPTSPTSPSSSTVWEGHSR